MEGATTFMVDLPTLVRVERKGLELSSKDLPYPPRAYVLLGMHPEVCFFPTQCYTFVSMFHLLLYILSREEQPQPGYSPVLKFLPPYK